MRKIIEAGIRDFKNGSNVKSLDKGKYSLESVDFDRLCKSIENAVKQDFKTYDFKPNWISVRKLNRSISVNVNYYYKDEGNLTVSDLKKIVKDLLPPKVKLSGNVEKFWVEKETRLWIEFPEDVYV